MLKLFSNAQGYGERIAIVYNNKSYTYKDLVDASNNIAQSLLSETNDLEEERIGFLIPPSFDYVCLQWGIWKAGGVGVPLSISATELELNHFLKNSKISVLITNGENIDRLRNLTDALNIKIKELKSLEAKQIKTLPNISPKRKAMILYTSGTTNKPKGVVSTHANIEAQIYALIKAWEWTKEDFIPLFLPLHHIHGIINSLSCPLWIGAKIEILGAFEVKKVIHSILKNKYSVFTAVPTIYFSLLDKMEKMGEKDLGNLKTSFKEMRLMMSGSAALAPEIHKKWTKFTDQILLERYGMTEVGMAISNPLMGERRPGFVGLPLPQVKICLMDKGKVIEVEDTPGEIMIKGPQVFSEYWEEPEITKESFINGWFKSGDVAILEKGYYKILGRDSVDIIKSGAYKISALEIEDTLLKHPSINECAVVGIEDKKWGEIVAVSLTLVDQEDISIKDLQTWSSAFLSSYKIPRKMNIVSELPKNSMGKINKPEIKKSFLI